MVGDDVVQDVGGGEVGGAKSAGISTAIIVRTGKYVAGEAVDYIICNEM